MAINDKLDYLLDTKQAIKQAIIDKGQEVADTDTFRSYAEKIEAIETGGGEDMLQARVDETNSCYYLFSNYGGTRVYIDKLDTSNVTTMANMFYNCSKLQGVNVSNFSTTNVIDMSNMFFSCGELQELDLSSFDTSNVTTMTSMFQGCKKLTSLDVSSFDTSNVTNVNQMFNNCNALTKLDLRNFDTKKLTSFYYMFSLCKQLVELNLSSFNTTNVSNFQNMFTQCNALATINLSSFDTRKGTNFSYMFQACYALTDIIGDINLILATNVSGIFDACRALTNVTLKNIKVNLQLGSGTSWGHLLSLDSLTNAINELWNMTGSTAKTLTIGSTNLEKLANVYVKLVTITDEMRAEDEYIDNKLPFIVCESTDEGAMLILDYARNLKNWNIS